MLRFCFHIRDRDRLILDEEGAELPNLDAALRERDSMQPIYLQTPAREATTSRTR